MSIFTEFLKNKNIIFKIRRSKVTDYAALIMLTIQTECRTSTFLYTNLCKTCALRIIIDLFMSILLWPLRAVLAFLWLWKSISSVWPNNALLRYNMVNVDKPINKKTEEGKDQERIQSSTIPDPGHPMGKWRKRKNRKHTREPRSQSFPIRQSQGYKDQTLQRQSGNINNKKFDKHSTTLERSAKSFEGLQRFYNANLAL